MRKCFLNVSVFVLLSTHVFCKSFNTLSNKKDSINSTSITFSLSQLIAKNISVEGYYYLEQHHGPWLNLNIGIDPYGTLQNDRTRRVFSIGIGYSYRFIDQDKKGFLYIGPTIDYLKYIYWRNIYGYQTLPYKEINRGYGIMFLANIGKQQHFGPFLLNVFCGIGARRNYAKFSNKFYTPNGEQSGSFLDNRMKFSPVVRPGISIGVIF